MSAKSWGRNIGQSMFLQSSWGVERVAVAPKDEKKSDCGGPEALVDFRLGPGLQTEIRRS